MTTGRLRELVHAVQLDPTRGETHTELGELLLELGVPHKALPAFATALALDPANARAWFGLDHAITLAPPDRMGDRVRSALRTAVGDGVVDATQIVNVIALAVSTLPSMRHLVDWQRAGVLEDRLATPDGHDALADPRLLELLELVRFVGIEVELALAALRHALLAGHGDLAICEALAIQCFANDFVYDVADDDRARVEALRAAVERATRCDATLWLQAATLGCFIPLHAVANRDLLAAYAMNRGGRAAALARIQIVEPMRELALRASIASFGALADPVSQRVRAQYEHAPYPRWTVQPDLRSPALARLTRPLPALAAHASPRILVAGCGTGKHPISVAMVYPHARVVAIDLSLASLAYARRMIDELELGARIDVRHGDLLDIEALGESFDAIEAIGVLHHLREPMAGWRALANVLRPGGWMKVGLYSAVARRPITELRARLAVDGVGRSDDDVRRYRTRLLRAPTDPVARAIARWPDFYALSECRDLLFHVEEHPFSLSEIGGALAALGLELGCFELPSMAPVRAYRARFPDDPAMVDLAHWAELEAAEPTLFAGMYQFWVRKPS